MIDLSEFTLVAAQGVAWELAEIPEAPGVYMILLRGGGRLVAAAMHLHPAAITVAEFGPFDLAYIGATASSLRLRLKRHLLGDSRTSSFRMSLGSVVGPTLGLRPFVTPNKGYFDFGQGEQALSDWVLERAVVAFRPCAVPFEEEAVALRRYASLLNIAGAKNTNNSRMLKKCRDNVRDGMLSRNTQFVVNDSM